MALLTFLLLIEFVFILIVNFTVQQRQNYEPKKEKAQESDSNTKAGEEIEINVPELDQTLATSCEAGVVETDNPMNKLPATMDRLPENQAIELTSTQSTNEQQITMVFPRTDFQPVLLQSSVAETQVTDLKKGFKIACLVISISGTGIITFLAGFSGKQTVTSKILFKASMLSMCASFLSGVALLILSIIHPRFSCLIRIAKTIMLVSAGLMTLAVVLLLGFYLQRT